MLLALGNSTVSPRRESRCEFPVVGHQTTSKNLADFLSPRAAAVRHEPDPETFYRTAERRFGTPRPSFFYDFGHRRQKRVRSRFKVAATTKTTIKRLPQRQTRRGRVATWEFPQLINSHLAEFVSKM